MLDRIDTPTSREDHARRHAERLAIARAVLQVARDRQPRDTGGLRSEDRAVIRSILGCDWTSVEINNWIHREILALDRRAAAAPTPAFSLGRLFSTPGALATLERVRRTPLDYLQRHQAGDWGDLGDEDRQANDEALRTGARLFSSYRLPGTDVRLWIITEAGRGTTTVLLPEEY